MRYLDQFEGKHPKIESPDTELEDLKNRYRDIRHTQGTRSMHMTAEEKESLENELEQITQKLRDRGVELGD